MKTLSIVSLITLSTFFSSLAHADLFNYKLQYWRKSLQATPGQVNLPQLLGEEELTMEASFPANPGEFDFDRKTLELAPFSGTLTLYWLHPTADTGNPPYFNVEISLNAPTRFYCSHSPRSDWGILPPLVCANEFNGFLYGITLINY